MLSKIPSGTVTEGDADTLSVSVVIPIFNEQTILPPNAQTLAGYFDDAVGPGNWLFIFVDNGSTDRTPALLRQIIARWPLCRVINLGAPNYGAALKAGLRAATTKWVYLLDIEQWDLPFMTWAWKNRDQYDVFLASKRADPTLNFQQPYRRLLSAALNAALQVLFRYSGTDTHGPKLLNRESLSSIIAKCELDRGQFDTELVLRAMRGRKRLVEVPMEYREFAPAPQPDGQEDFLESGRIAAVAASHAGSAVRRRSALLPLRARGRSGASRSEADSAARGRTCLTRRSRALGFTRPSVATPKACRPPCWALAMKVPAC